MKMKTWEQTFMMKNKIKSKQFHIKIIMDIFLPADQILGMEWKKKKLKKKEDVCKLTMFRLKLTGKLKFKFLE